MLVEYLIIGALALLLYRIVKSFVLDHRNHPKSIRLPGLPTVFGRWTTALWAQFKYSDLAAKTYAETAGEPFAIPTLTNYHFFISESEKISEICNAPDSQLSFNEFLNDMLNREHLGTHLDPNDPQNRIDSLVLQNRLRAKIPDLKFVFQSAIETALGKLATEKKDSEGWMKISASSLSHAIVGHVNCFAVLGHEISQNPKAIDLVMGYIRDAVVTAGVLRFTPKFMQGSVAHMIMGRSGARRQLENLISLEAQRRLHQQQVYGNDKGDHADCLQWAIEILRSRNNLNVLEVTQITLGLLFAAAFQAPMLITYAFYCLGKYPENMKALQDEASELQIDDLVSFKNQDAPLIDSFLKETARHFPLQAGTAYRKAMTDFTFSDGTIVPAGSFICVPQQAIMLDAKIYDRSHLFDAFRFVGDAADTPKTSSSRFSQPSTTFLLWGAIGRPCPGRFYVSAVAKMILGHIIKNYELKLADENQSPTFGWGMNLIPHPKLKILLRERR